MWMLIRCIIITFLQVLNAAETGGNSKWLDDNDLKCIASNGKPCIFPFQFNEKVVVTFDMWYGYQILLIDYSGVYILRKYFIFIGL